MKVSEALSERKMLKDRMARLTRRLADNVRTPENEDPQEDPAALRQEITVSLAQMLALIVRVNNTNIHTTLLLDGFTHMTESNNTTVSVTEAIAMRDIWLQMIDVLRSAAEAVGRRDHYETLKTVARVRGGDLERELDLRARDLRVLDHLIQRSNFDTDLMEVVAL